MFIKQFYTNCLSQAAYYVESEGEALVIDPLRDVSVYVELAKQRQAKIRYVFETHFHADFVSGHLDLSRQTGAVIVFGSGAKPAFQALSAIDGEIFSLGKIKIKVLHTPGHTLESCCFLLFDEDNKAHSVFTGDTLFVGDVGRPDLLSGNLSKEDLAGMLYDSLQKKIKKLPDHVIVYPGHGAGSACGKNIGKETQSTIGEQKKNNHALQNISKDEFVKSVCNGLPVPPAYFFKDAYINSHGYENLDKVVKTELKPLSETEFRSLREKGALILDCRNGEDFAKGHIKDSVNIGLGGQFAFWVGTLIEFGKPLLLVCDSGKEEETVTRLARVGYENVLGYLKGGITGWHGTLKTVDMVPSKAMSEYRREYDPILLDVRNASEVQNFSIHDALHIPLNQLQQNLSKLNKEAMYLVGCAGGYRSMMACSLMKQAGFSSVVNLKEGLNACVEQVAAKK